MKIFSNSLVLSLTSAALFALAAIAEARAAESEIGRITFVDKKYWAMRISGDEGGERDAAKDGIIREHDTLQTIAGQHLMVLLDDGTTFLLGPSSRLTFTNWTKRDSDNRLKKILTLHTGMMKAIVRKIYSEDEPFAVVNKYGVVAVRGTEFVVEAGPAGRLEYARRLTPAEAYDRRHEVEVHTLEGEVYFARTLEEIRDHDKRVTVKAGESSLVRLGMARPQPARYFNLPKFADYVMKAAPGVKFLITRNTTNNRRSERATNVKQEGLAHISPARPGYAKVHNPTRASAVGISEGEEGSRGIASSAPKDANPESFKQGKFTSDGVKDAFHGDNQNEAARKAGGH